MENGPVEESRTYMVVMVAAQARCLKISCHQRWIRSSIASRCADDLINKQSQRGWSSSWGVRWVQVLGGHSSKSQEENDERGTDDIGCELAGHRDVLY